MKQKFNVTGMSCSACSANIEKTLRKQSGVEKAEVNLLSNSMQVSYDENIISEANHKDGRDDWLWRVCAGEGGGQCAAGGCGCERGKIVAAPVRDFACFACAADVYFNVSYVLRVVRSADSGVYDGAVSRR